MKRYIHPIVASDYKIPKSGINVNEKSVFTWNGFYYGSKKIRNNIRYFKSHSVRFDNSCGGTEEITVDEYTEAAEKYARVFR